MKNPEFVMFVGAMFSGKTSKLLARLDRLKYQKKKFIAFKPDMDVRYNKSYITTHLGAKVHAICIKRGSDIFSYVDDDHDVIAVDEAFMIPDVSAALIEYYQQGKTILVSSLDMSATLQPFKEMENMYRWATKIEKCPAVCTECDCDAFYTHKKIFTGNEIEIGGEELYEPRCFKHHDHLRLIGE